MSVNTDEIAVQAQSGGIDYQDLSGQVVTIPGDGVSTSATVTVSINADFLVEDKETFQILLSQPELAGAADATRVGLGDDRATGTILDDDSENTAIVGDCICDGDLGGPFRGRHSDQRINRL